MQWRSLEESALPPQSRALREIYDKRRQLIAQYVPAEIQAVHARAVGDLKASGNRESSVTTRKTSAGIRTARPKRQNCSFG